MSQNDPRISGAGPFDFENEDSLAVDGRMVLPFEDMKHNKVKKGYRRYLPFSEIAVTNLSPESRLRVTYNHTGVQTIPPNTVESIDSIEITSLIVENMGPTAIESGNVRIEALKSQYGADDSARQQIQESAIERFVSSMIGY